MPSGETLVIEVHSYRVFMLPAVRYGDVVHALDPVIFLYDATDRFFARLHFSLDEDLDEAQAATLDGLPWFRLIYPRDYYPFVLDMLRNEKPVYLHFSGTPSVPHLTTSSEPVGEGELPG